MIKYIYFIFLFVVLVLFLVFHFKSIYVEEFHGAVDSGDLDHISELLQEGYDINAPDSLEWYPIHTAIMKRDEKLLKFLLENGANINSQSKQGWTPLHYAVAVTSGYSGARLLSVKYKKNIRNSKNYRYLNKEDWPKSIWLVDFLLDSGANINIADNKGDTPLDVAVITNHMEVIRKLVPKDNAEKSKSNALLNAAKEKNPEAVQLLLELGFDVNAKDDYENTPLHLAISRNHKDDKQNKIVITKLLLDNKASVAATNKRKQTPLILAAKVNTPIEIIRLLVDHNSEIDARDEEGNTALYYASKRNSTAEAELYIGKGADVNNIAHNGQTPLHAAAHLIKPIELLLSHGAKINAVDNNGLLPIHLAASGHTWKAIELLIDHGAKINAADNNGELPIHKAAVRKNKEFIETLANYGATINAPNYDGALPIHLAAKHNNDEGLLVLLSLGAYINKQDHKGQTPLHYAARWKPYEDSFRADESQKPETLITLLNQGADFTIKDVNGLTAVDIAKREGDEKAVKILEDFSLSHPPLE